MYATMLIQVSLHVEEDVPQKHAPVNAPYDPPTETQAESQSMSQRDLDDPAIDDGVASSGIPLRKRKLFAQPLTTGGPTSDASSEDDSDESLG